MNFPSRCILTLAYAWSAVALGASSSGGDISQVIGSVRLDDGQAASDVSTVNGSVTVGAAARAERSRPSTARSASRSVPSSSRPGRSTAM